MSSLGDKVRSLRLERGMSQSQLCTDLVTFGMMSLIESGKTVPSQQVLTEIARRLQVDPAWFEDDVLKSRDIQGRLRQARVHLHRQEWSSAIPVFEQLLASPWPHFREESIWHDLATCYEELGETDRAAGSWGQVARLSLDKNDVPAATRAYTEIGNLYRRANNFWSARVFWRRAAELLEHHPELRVAIGLRICSNLGRVYAGQREFALSKRFYQRALDYLGPTHSDMERALITHGLASACAELGQLDESDAWTSEAQALYASLAHERGLNQCRLNQAVILRLRGRVGQSLHYLDEIAPSMETDPLRLGNLHLEKANCHVLRREWQAALEELEEASRNSHLLAEVSVVRTKCLVGLGEYDQALEAASNCERLADAQHDAFVTCKVANIRRESFLGLNDENRAIAAAHELAEVVLQFATAPHLFNHDVDDM